MWFQTKAVQLLVFFAQRKNDSFLSSDNVSHMAKQAHKVQDVLVQTCMVQFYAYQVKTL